MIQSLTGVVHSKSEHAVVVLVGGVGFKVAVPAHTAQSVEVGGTTSLATYLHVREGILDLYGFETEQLREFFEQLISVNGVGPRSGLAILDVADLSELTASIQQGRPDLLTKAAGVGRKTAERVVLELRGKVIGIGSEKVVAAMDEDSDLVDTLAALGYKKEQVRAAIAKIDPALTSIEDRLKKALNILTGKHS